MIKKKKENGKCLGMEWKKMWILLRKIEDLGNKKNLKGDGKWMKRIFKGLIEKELMRWVMVKNEKNVISMGEDIVLMNLREWRKKRILNKLKGGLRKDWKWIWWRKGKVKKERM